MKVVFILYLCTLMYGIIVDILNGYLFVDEYQD